MFLLFLIINAIYSKLIVNTTYETDSISLPLQLNITTTYLVQLLILQFPMAENCLPYLGVRNSSNPQSLNDEVGFATRSVIQQVYVSNSINVTIDIFSKNMTGIPATNNNITMQFIISVQESPQKRKECIFPSYGVFCEQNLKLFQTEILYKFHVQATQWFYAYYVLDNNDYQLYIDNYDQTFGLAMLPIDKTEITQLPSFTYLFQAVHPQQHLNIKLNRQADISNYIFAIGLYNFHASKSQSIDVLITKNQLSNEVFPTWAIILIVIIVFLGCSVAAIIWCQMNRQHHRLLLSNQIKPALDRNTLNKYMPSQKLKFIDEHQTCCICLVQFEKTDKIRISPCKHIFHDECLSDWTTKQANCPVCRQILHEDDIKQFEKAKKIFPDVSQMILKQPQTIRPTITFIQDQIQKSQTNQADLDNSPQNQHSIDKVLADQIEEGM